MQSHFLLMSLLKASVKCVFNGATEVAQSVEAIAAKADDLSSIPVTHKERADFHRLMTHTHYDTHPHVHTQRDVRIHTQIDSKSNFETPH